DRSGRPIPKELRDYVYEHYFASHNNQQQQPEIIWPEPPAVQHLSDIHSPTLVLVGSLDTAQIQEMGDLLTSGIPNARKVMIDQTAHLPNMEQPVLFNSLLQDFIASTAG
ncbi:MAG: hypothetical protein KC496_20640, partial [Anaerolineae bacterium]|nr:hypothetical protein [Anaerolineae bacterium]